MIVFDLKCGDGGHVFEAWFGSSEDFAEQCERELVACPICGSTDIKKAAMAPSVGAKGNSKGDSVPMRHGDETGPAGGDAEMKALLAKLAKAQAKALEKSDYVGDKFADEARAMHDGEKDDRPIHGETSLAEAKSLVEDGVPVAPLPFAVRRPEEQN